MLNIIVNFQNVNVIVNLMVVVVLFGISGSMVSVCINSEKEDRNYSKKITKIILTQSSATATVIVSSLCIDKPMKTNKELSVMIRRILLDGDGS